MIHTISSGKGIELGNNVDTASEGNASDLANFCTDEKAHHNMHDGVLYQKICFQITQEIKCEVITIE